MNTRRSITIGLAIAALIGAAGIAAPASAQMQMTAKQTATMTSCMAMTGERMMRSSRCKTLMSKMNVRRSDMQMMIACRGMSHGDMADNPDCVSLMKQYPQLMNMPVG